MLNSPDYIAFRAPNGPGLLTFVAALVPGDRGSFPWAKWYSESAPNASSGWSPEATSASQSAMP